MYQPLYLQRISITYFFHMLFFVLLFACWIHNTSMLVMDIGNKNALESVLVPKFLCYSHIFICLLTCLQYHPAMVEFFFCVHIAYSYHDFWSLFLRTLCRAFFQLKSISNTPPCNGSTLLCLPLLFGSLLRVVNSCSTHYFNIVNAFANVVLLPSSA